MPAAAAPHDPRSPLPDRDDATLALDDPTRDAPAAELDPSRVAVNGINFPGRRYAGS